MPPSIRNVTSDVRCDGVSPDRAWNAATCSQNATVKDSMSAPESRFVKACRAQPVDRTPVWFMRQAGRYMPEYRAVRKQYSLIEICKKPEVAAEVTITAAEALGVDAAIIFADLLLPLEVMGLAISFFGRRRPGHREAGARSGGHVPPAHRSCRRSGIRLRSSAPGVQALRQHACR